MKSRLGLFAIVVGLLLSHTAKASKTILPDACGDDKVSFNVDTDKNATGTKLPDVKSGKAQIVFIETYLKSRGGPLVIGGGFVTRFGMDGAWVGAAKSNTFFTVDVTPGEHHLCSSVKGSKKMIGMTTFTAEAGKTYFFEYKIDMETSQVSGTVMGAGGGPVFGTQTSVGSNFSQLNEDEGAFRIKASTPAQFAPKSE